MAKAKEKMKRLTARKSDKIMADKPRLLLMQGKDTADPDKLAEFFYQLTGRRATAKEIEDARHNRPVRKQGEARKVATHAYPIRCCVVCGLQIGTCLTVAHLDQNAGNNGPENLAFMCQTHHWMYDAGLYPIEAIVLLRAHWQETGGKPSHKARMKDAGAKAARTRKRSATARKSWATRRRNMENEKISKT